MLRSVVAVVAAITRSVSVDELFVSTGSIPAGAPTLAMVVIDVFGATPEPTVAFTVYVIVAPAGRLTVWPMFPAPFVAPVAPPVVLTVYVMLVSSAGKLSVTVAPPTAFGPALVTTIA